MSGDSIRERKAALRRSAEAHRQAAHAAGAAACADALMRHGMEVLGDRRFRAVSGYWPIRSEMDVRPLLLGLADQGRDIALPVVAGPGRALGFRRWRPGLALVAGPFGTAHPPAEAVSVEPDVLLVPLLAFDRQHRRLGYGAGYYDRTLAGLRAKKRVLVLGVAYAAQAVDEVPADGWDEPLDLVLTEHGIV